MRFRALPYPAFYRVAAMTALIVCFRLVKDDGLGTFKNFIRDFHAVDAELFIDGPADGRVQVVEGRQAVHEYALRTGFPHDFRGNPVGQEVLDPGFPYLIRFPHGNPDVGIDHMGAGDGSGDVFLKLQHGAGFGGDLPALVDQAGIRMVFLRRAGDEVHAHFGAAHHQGIAHIVTGVPHVNQLDAGEGTEVLPDGQEVSQDLGRVEFIGQAVPDRNAGIAGQVFHDLLPETAVFDSVKHTAEHPGGIGDAFLFADLAAGGIQVGAVHSQVVRGDLEGAARTRTRLFKNQGNILTGEFRVRDPGFFLLFQIRRQIQQAGDVRRRRSSSFRKERCERWNMVRHSLCTE